MKKGVILFAAVTLFVALGFSSCKSTQECPAYSKVNVENSIEKA